MLRVMGWNELGRKRSSSSRGAIPNIAGGTEENEEKSQSEPLVAPAGIVSEHTGNRALLLLYPAAWWDSEGQFANSNTVTVSAFILGMPRSHLDRCTGCLAWSSSLFYSAHPGNLDSNCLLSQSFEPLYLLTLCMYQRREINQENFAFCMILWM